MATHSPWACPPDKTRKSMAFYYYTTERDDEFADAPLHRTTYVGLPDAEPNERLDHLRDARNKNVLPRFR